MFQKAHMRIAAGGNQDLCIFIKLPKRVQCAGTTGDKELIFLMHKDDLISGLHVTCLEETKGSLLIHLKRSCRPSKGVYK